MPGLEIKGYAIDDLTKALGAIAISCYILGYLVLSYFESGYGFNPASPFRPRVLATGICTLAFFAVPILIGTAVASIPRRGLPKPLAILIRALCLPWLCETTSFLLSLELPRSIDSGAALRKYVLILPLSLLLAAIVMWTLTTRVIPWIWRNYHKRVIPSVVVLCLISGWFVYWGVGSSATQYERRSFLWFLLVSAIACILIGDAPETRRAQLAKAKAIEHKRKINEITSELTRVASATPENGVENSLSLEERGQLLKEAKAVENTIDQVLSDMHSDTSTLRLERFVITYGPLSIFPFLLLALAVFSTWVFPTIPLKFGGGKVISATVYRFRLDRTLSVIDGKVLDQSDEGIYIVPTGHDKGLFIPKEGVEAIYFSDDPSGIDKVIQ